MFTLGAAEDVQVTLYTRGCKEVLGQYDAPVGDVSWNRKLDATSEASAKFLLGGMSDGELCCEDFGQIWPWAVEMSISWNCEVIWLGPITEVIYSPQYLEIKAADWSALFDRRIIDVDSNHLQAPVTEIWQDYFDIGMKKENSAGIYLEMEDCGTRMTRNVLAEDKSTVADCLRELATGSIDWYMHGRMMVITCPENDHEKGIIALNGSDFITPPTVRIRGNDQATCVYVKGGTPQEEGTFGVDDGVATGFTVIPNGGATLFSPPADGEEEDPDATVVEEEEQSTGQVFQVPGNTITTDNFEDQVPICGKACCEDWTEFAGLLERVFDEQNIINQVDAEDEAEARLAELKRPVFLELDGQLKPCAPVTWDELRPGTLISLSSTATCFELSDIYRLQEVKGDSSGNVQVMLQPLGASSLR